MCLFGGVNEPYVYWAVMKCRGRLMLQLVAFGGGGGMCHALRILMYILFV